MPLLRLADRFHRALGGLLGATSAPLTDTPAIGEVPKSALGGGPMQRPGMVRVAEGGAAIDMEIWEMPAPHFGSFVDGIPAPLGIGKVKLADGGRVSGFVYEALGAESGSDITALGSWRAWLAR